MATQTPSMKDKICLVTGATAGIGEVLARELARQGATVLMVCRDRDKGERLQQEIEAETKNRPVLLVADLSSQASIRTLAGEVKARFDRLDVLINNAGGIFGERKLTVDGIEHTFALNHLAYFLLTDLLLDLLKKAAPSRIINLSSGAQGMGKIDFDDLQGEKKYGGQKAYSQSKLANVLFTYELSRRLEGTGVVANCVHPGVVNTNFGNTASRGFRIFVWFLRPLMRTPEKGAETALWLATSEEGQKLNGKYVVDKKPKTSSKASYDLSISKRLWEISAKMVNQPA